MQIKQIYVADDGKVFDSERDCENYEEIHMGRNMLQKLTEEKCPATWEPDINAEVIYEADVTTFIINNFNEIEAIYKKYIKP